jgi:hypothetical protein
MQLAFFSMRVFHHGRRGPPPTAMSESKPFLNWCSLYFVQKEKRQ